MEEKLVEYGGNIMEVQKAYYEAWKQEVQSPDTTVGLTKVCMFLEEKGGKPEGLEGSIRVHTMPQMVYPLQKMKFPLSLLTIPRLILTWTIFSVLE